ncbi:MAG: ABC transporter substrate-binding protein [Candidatus Eremiobacteraeota bacterium]|nr:ABC transporter substrate-binding protein [Candidatus Eremiobacteraeota bacterium]
MFRVLANNSFFVEGQPMKKSRRTFLAGAAGSAAAAAGFGTPILGRAADMVNIGGLYPVTGGLGQIGQGCVNAAKLAVKMVNDAGGIKSLGGAKLNLLLSDVQSDPTVTRTETDRLISGNKLSAIHGCYASALTLIASEVAERAQVPLITGSSSDKLNEGRKFTFTPFARASQFAQAQLQMSKLVSDKPKVAVVFENTAFGTSTSNGLKEQAPGEGVEIVMFEPYSAGFTDASPLINKVRASGANMLFAVSYLNDLILIVRTMKQMSVNMPINGGSGGFVQPEFYKNVGAAAEGLLGVGHWNHDIDADAQRVNVEFKKEFGEFIFEYAGGLVAQTFMLADALERAASPDPVKVRDALASGDYTKGYAAMAPGGHVKFMPNGRNQYGHPVGVQWQKGDLVSVFPKNEARKPLMKV